jgi:glycolate oxidase
MRFEEARMHLPAALAMDLRQVLAPRTVVTEPEDLPAFGQDFRGPRGIPGIVVRPYHAVDVVATLRYAADHGVPVATRAAGTNFTASFLPSPEKILLDTRAMNRVVRVDPESGEAVVQPGVINGDLNAQLAPLGLCFSPDPASTPISSIGGNIATNAGGPHCLKYGVTFHHVLGMECALLGGDTLHLRADDAGPDLLGVVIGSEGTLAIVTEATLRLRPLPPETRTLLAVFADAAAAAQAVFTILATGVIPAALEYVDAAAIAMFDHYAPSGYPADAGALLLVDLDGTLDEVAADMLVVEAVLRQVAREVRRADDAPTRAELWRSRLHSAHAIVATGQQFFTGDTTVPPSRIPALQQAITAVAQRHHLAIPTVGHAGDGNLHPVILFDGSDGTQRTAAERAHEELIAAALALGGTITGEHGVGSEKLHSMVQRFRPAEMAAMRAVKAAFDPIGLLNPGILLPPPGPTEPSLPLFDAAVRAAVDGRRCEQTWTASTEPTISGGGETAITVDTDNRTVTVSAATPLGVFHDSLEVHDLCSPLPKDVTTVGALVSSGTTARAAVRETLLGVSAQLPDGPAVLFGGSLLKDVAGYDLKRLYIGSATMFGVVQEVTLQVHVQRGRDTQGPPVTIRDAIPGAP